MPINFMVSAELSESVMSVSFPTAIFYHCRKIAKLSLREFKSVVIASFFSHSDHLQGEANDRTS
jgi:hypothetical protein